MAALLGGSRVPLDGELQSGPFLGLDWFLLNLMAYSAVFIPLERLFARLPEQAVFRAGLADRPRVLLPQRAAGAGHDVSDA